MRVLTLSLASLRHQARRYLAPGLAVVLGIAFIATTLILTDTLSSSVRQSVAGQYAPYAAVIVPEDAGEQLPESVLAQAQAVDGVTRVDAVRSGAGFVASASGKRYAVVTTGIPDSAHSVLEGRLPEAPREVAVSESAAGQLGLKVGEQAPFVTIDDSGDPRYSGGTPAVFATPGGVTELTGTKGWNELDVASTTAPQELTATLADAVDAKGARASLQRSTPTRPSPNSPAVTTCSGSSSSLSR